VLVVWSCVCFVAVACESVGNDGRSVFGVLVESVVVVGSPLHDSVLVSDVSLHLNVVVLAEHLNLRTLCAYLFMVFRLVNQTELEHTPSVSKYKMF
jgi:hypothetical protein